MLLRRATKLGYGAVLVLRTTQGRSVFQRKTPGYPYPAMVGRLCLFGGGREKEDKSGRSTLMRELDEELPPIWTKEIEKTLRPFARYIVLAPKEVMAPEPVTFGCTTCVFEASISDALLSEGRVLEGEMIVMQPSIALARQRYAWGTGSILRDYLSTTGEQNLMDSYLPDNLSAEVEAVDSDNVKELGGDPWSQDGAHGNSQMSVISLEDSVILKMDPFAHQAKQYLLSRPTYPSLFLDRIRARAPATTQRSSTCLDVGCGSGQLTETLIQVFDRVVGVDRSKPQLEQALVSKLKLPSADQNRIEYLSVDDATKLIQFPSESFDCVTVAQTLHWLPLKQSLTEFSRVLRPGGILAAMGYGVCRVDNSPSVQAAFREYYVDTLGSERPLSDPRCKWDCDRRRLDTGHAGEVFSPPFGNNIERLWCEDSRTVSDQDFLTYLSTWSAYQKLLRSPEWTGKDPLDRVRTAIDKEKKDLHIVFPFWLILASKV